MAQQLPHRYGSSLWATFITLHFLVCCRFVRVDPQTQLWLELHYHDNFYTLDPPNSPVCQNNLNTCLWLFKDWHIPLDPDKMEGPSTCLTMLGIELDSLTLKARLPRGTFKCITALLESWSVKQHCTRKELESLTGTLHHLCKVIP